jgi:triosephosphate isomerase
MNTERRPLIAGNWKMNKTGTEARAFVQELLIKLPSWEDREVLLCPPFTALSVIGPLLQGSPVRLGAQDLYPEESGAFTGEISPPMLVDAGCTHAILGHSERRRYFQEDDTTIQRKAVAALGVGLRPILCIGESLPQREAGQASEVVLGQLRAALANLSAEEVLSVVVAYEPIWAIGTGRTATPDQAQEMHALIRREIGRLWGHEVAERLRLLYGGSVRPDNADQLMACPDIDGALVGGASLEVEGFLRIVGFSKAS